MAFVLGAGGAGCGMVEAFGAGLLAFLALVLILVVKVPLCVAHLVNRKIVVVFQIRAGVVELTVGGVSRYEGMNLTPVVVLVKGVGCLVKRVVKVPIVSLVPIFLLL